MAGASDADVVYLVRPGDTNEELRYSLRSLKNVPHREVVMAGYKPRWVTGVRHIPVEQTAGKQRNAAGNLQAVLADADLSENFWLFNDDFYALRPVASLEDVWLNRGLIGHVVAEHMSKGVKSAYVQMMRDTEILLHDHGFVEAWSYELHVPLPVRREEMIEALASLGWVPGRHHWRSMYGNWHARAVGDSGRTVEDVKVYSRCLVPALDATWVSTSDVTFGKGRVGRFLRSLLSEKSPYEA